MSSARQQIGQKTGVGASSNARLFRALAEDLRLPLQQIARSSELGRLDEKLADARQIEATAGAALKLIDSYLFSTQILLSQQKLELEPVSPKAMLYDTAQYMHELAKLYNYDIGIDVSRQCGLVMAHPQGFQAALTSLAYAFISGLTPAKQGRITLTARRAGYGVAAGVLVTGKKISRAALKTARDTYGEVRQPLAESAHTTAAGIYVADSLFEAMASELKTKSVRGSSGLVATLLPSQQLALL